jgi:hypothetical protein
MAGHWRLYLAGVLHGAGCLWVAGWALSHWGAAPVGVFGPTGWLPVSVTLVLFLLGSRLLAGGCGLSSVGAARPAEPGPPAGRPRD